MLRNSHSPKRAVFSEGLMRTILLLILSCCILKNTAAFIHDLDKLMLIYNQGPHQSLSNFSPREVL